MIRQPYAAASSLSFSFSKSDAMFLRAHGFAMAAYTVGVASLLTVVLSQSMWAHRLVEFGRFENLPNWHCNPSLSTRKSSDNPEPQTPDLLPKVNPKSSNMNSEQRNLLVLRYPEP